MRLFCAERSTPSIAYDWYRRGAQLTGHASFDGVRIEAIKHGREWHVARVDLQAAIASLRQRLAAAEANTKDYRNKIYPAADGETVPTTWGHYVLRRPFRFVFSIMEHYRKRSDGARFCNDCDRVATVDEATGALSCAHCGHVR